MLNQAMVIEVKKEWIVDDNDVQEFWEKCGGKKEATLWATVKDLHTVRKLKEGPIF